MNKIKLIFIAVSLPLIMYSQINPESFNLGKFLEKNIKELNVSGKDVSNLIITDQYISKHNGVRHIYYTQAYDDIPIHNAILNLNITKENEVVHFGNRLINDISSKIRISQAELNVEEAFKIQFDKIGLAKDEPLVLLKKNNKYSYEFKQTSFSVGNILASLKYLPIEDELILAYECRVMDKNSSHNWSTFIDANSGEILQHTDETLYCSFSENHYHNHRASCFNKSEKIIAPSILNSVTGTYNVYSLPTESPLHGPRELVSDPHFPEASPFGWHDIDGMEGHEFTITRGNNVHAYRDADDNGSPSQVEPDGTDALIFDFPHTTDAEPDASIDADVTNLFYMNNMMHDISYLFGFDEAAGNFQSNNNGNGGSQGDHVRAEAQDGANLLDADHTGNANFSSGPDGSNGRMQMYYWGQAQGATNITEPAELAGPLEVAVPTATDWGFIYSQQFSQLDIEEKLVVVDDGTVGNPSRACNPLVNADEIDSHIALIDRGVCEFGTKSFNAQEAGAVAVIICNVPGVNGGDGDEFVSMAGGVEGINVTIPALFARYSDCQRIKASINAGNDVIIKIKEIENSGPTYYSSSFDNGVVAHEYAHGISGRLTGGPSSPGCLPSYDDDGDGYAERAEQMGEGWSDFFSLIVTAEPGDSGTDVRGIGNYVDGGELLSRGIRRFPYSTDMSVNPQTMEDIVNGSGIHQTGEVWADVLWDMYWALVDVYGWDSDWRNIESGNYKAIQLVMDGMKFQPCAPGFVDGRDAILLADQVNYGGENQCLIWDIFARRGIGINADQGSTLTQRDNIENFESLPTCIAELKIKKEIASILIPGEQTEVLLSFANHTVNDMINVRITDELPDNAEFISHNSNYVVDVVDNMVIFTIGDMASLDEDTIRYSIQSDPSIKSEILYSDNNEDSGSLNNNWDRDIIEGTNFWQINGLEEFSYSGYNSWYILEIDEVTKSDLIYKSLSVDGENPVLRFWHKYNTTQSVNAGYVELSRDGVIWEDVQRLFIRNRYPSSINYGTFAIPSLEGFSGNSDGFEDSFIDLSDYKGEDISIRFKFGTDETGNFFAPDNGWFVDDIDLIDLIEYDTEACITSDTDSGCSGIMTSFVEASLISSSNELITNGLEWYLYPNPASKFINLEVLSDKSFKAKIIINSGHGYRVREISTQIQPNNNIIRLDTSDLPAGLYTIQLLNGNKVMTRKLILH